MRSLIFPHSSNIRRLLESASLLIILVYVLIAPAHGQSVDLQDNCSAQAKRTFQEMQDQSRAKARGVSIKVTSSNYHSHYNTKLDRCLMLVERDVSIEQQLSTGMDLIDANDRHVYGIYLSIGDDMVTCQLTPSLDDKRACKSRDEFDAYAASYMKQ